MANDNPEDYYDSLLLYLYRIETFNDDTNPKFVYSRHHKLFLKSLPIEERCNRYSYIPRCALHNPGENAWERLYFSGCNHAMIACTGFDYTTFNWMLGLFSPYYYEALSPHHSCQYICFKKQNGCLRVLNSPACLAYILVWTQMRGSTNHLNMIFGVLLATSSVSLRFGHRILCHVLSRQDSAKVKLPDNLAKVNEYVEAVGRKHPTLGEERVAFSIDGVKLDIEKAGDENIQQMFYNGWTHGNYVGNILVFAPDGTIVALTINVPGCIHECTIATYGNVYDNMADLFQKFQVKSVVDSAFMSKKNPFMIQSSKKEPTDIEDGDFRTMRMHCEATSYRQTAEWGMGTLQRSFPRIKDEIIYEELGERVVILKLLVLLFNVRANKVGISQIKNTYMSLLKKNPLNVLSED